MSAHQPTLFPIFLKLEGKPCLVVGGGPIAEGKITGLLRSGARVKVVSPELTASLAAHAETRAIDWQPRNFELADLDGAFLVIAATSSFDANALIYQEADRRGILCNAVDQPLQCHFYYPRWWIADRCRLPSRQRGSVRRWRSVCAKISKFSLAPSTSAGSSGWEECALP